MHSHPRMYLWITSALLRLLKGCTTPLLMACKMGNLKAVKALLDCGADPRAEGFGHERNFNEDFQVFPLSVASLAGNLNLVQLLLEHGKCSVLQRYGDSLSLSLSLSLSPPVIT